MSWLKNLRVEKELVNESVEKEVLNSGGLQKDAISKVHVMEDQHGAQTETDEVDTAAGDAERIRLGICLWRRKATKRGRFTLDGYSSGSRR